MMEGDREIFDAHTEAARAEVRFAMSSNHSDVRLGAHLLPSGKLPKALAGFSISLTFLEHVRLHPKQVLIIKFSSFSFQVMHSIFESKLVGNLNLTASLLGKRGKLNPRYVGPFNIVKRIGRVAYQLDLPEGLSGVHNFFHVSNLKKLLTNETLTVPLEQLQIAEQLRFVEELVEIMDMEVKTLKHGKIPIVRVRWNSKHGPIFTWEREDQMMCKYPHLFRHSTSNT
ncbi:hypothetical protein L1987_20578 [Smallanthus sonchifolius]|uniref:Uncharacterized protein n=1 Tax=Smallanthus sonchifolius TaxID=185202 RepID=A0ACB9ISW1_9ASTR|nr:hypothetical protein L1987_20578 [Smallanthus sonchifolius]